MRRTKRRFVAAALILAMAFTSVSAVPAFAAKAVRSATIYAFEGDVKIQRGGDKTIPAFEGMRLQENDTILTGTNSSAVIAIDSDKTIDVDANTEITLDALSGDTSTGQTSTSVFYGNTVNTIKNKLTEGSTFETKTSTAVMGVRGTSYLVSQDTEDVDVIVSTGTVAVSPVSKIFSAAKPETIPVTKGKILQYYASRTDNTPFDMNAESLMALSPAVAKALVTDEFLENIPDKPKELTEAGQLIAILNERQTEAVKEAGQRKAAQEVMAAEAQKAEPAAFFAAPGETLIGQNNVLLIPTETKVEIGESPAPAQSIPAARPKDTPQNAAPAPSPTGQSPKIPEADNSIVSPPENIQNKTPGSKPDGSSGGSSEGGSSVKPSEPERPTEPEIPTVPEVPVRPSISITGLKQDTVYEEASVRTSSGNLIALVVSWQKPEEANGYQLEIKHGGGSYIPFTPPADPMENSNEYRVVLPKENKGSLNHSTLKITPKVGTEFTPVSAEIKLDFDTPTSNTIKKLSMPLDLALSKTGPDCTLSFAKVEDAAAYRIGIYKDGSLLENSQISGSDAVVTYLLDTKPLSGDVTVKVAAVGDGFDRWDSSEQVQNFYIPPERTQLANPEASLTLSHFTGLLYGTMSWRPVIGASRYRIEFRSGSNSYPMSSDYFYSFNKITYTLSRQELSYISDPETTVWIAAFSDSGAYLDSEWVEVTIPDLPPEPLAVATPANAKAVPPATSSNARPSDTDSSHQPLPDATPSNAAAARRSAERDKKSSLLVPDALLPSGREEEME